MYRFPAVSAIDSFDRRGNALQPKPENRCISQSYVLSRLKCNQVNDVLVVFTQPKRNGSGRTGTIPRMLLKKLVTKRLYHSV